MSDTFDHALDAYESFINDDGFGGHWPEGTYDDPHGTSDRYYYREQKASGSGPCPKCGANTIKRTGRYGEFYGCTTFPKCTGSRKI